MVDNLRTKIEDYKFEGIIKHYLNNLNADALKQVAIQLILNPNSKFRIIKCAKEFDNFYPANFKNG